MKYASSFPSPAPAARPANSFATATYCKSCTNIQDGVYSFVVKRSAAQYNIKCDLQWIRNVEVCSKCARAGGGKACTEGWWRQGHSLQLGTRVAHHTPSPSPSCRPSPSSPTSPSAPSCPPPVSCSFLASPSSPPSPPSSSCSPPSCCPSLTPSRSMSRYHFLCSLL